MTRKKNRATLIMYLASFLMILVLFFSTVGFVTDGDVSNAVRVIDDVWIQIGDQEKQKVHLPHSFSPLEDRTPAVVEGTIPAGTGDALYVKSVYSPCKIFVDGQLVYEFGTEEEYPSFMKDPATEVHVIELGEGQAERHFRMEFLSPVFRHTLTIHPPIAGTAKALIFKLFQHLGIPLLLSVVQMIAGAALIFVSVCVAFMDKKGILFLWLGLFSLTAGMWSFGENNFTGLMIKNPTFLYLLAFTGLFTFIVPLLRFTRTIIDFENPVPVWLMEIFFLISSFLALFLQWLGLVPCAKSMYFFHALLPAALVILTFLTADECFRHKNSNARRFILPIAILALSALLELFNYRFPLTYVFSSFFQMGIIIFLLLMGIMVGFSIKDNMNLKNKEKKLALEQKLMDIQVKEQKSHSLILARHEELLRQQRHDLRHHLNVIQELASRENTALQEYLKTLMDNIPKASEKFCENRAVNSILSYYSTLCRQKNIRLSLHLAVEENNPHLKDVSLCIIFGNLLENAVEACDRMTGGNKFIQLNSSVQYDLLTITMDNSFNGEMKKQGERFFSSKRNALGIGLSSIQSVAKKEQGNAEFKAEGNVFMSSVYVRI